MNLQKSETGKDLENLMNGLNVKRKDLSNKELEICKYVKTDLCNKIRKTANKEEYNYVKKHLEDCNHVFGITNFLSNCEIFHTFMVTHPDGVNTWCSFQPETLQQLRHEKDLILKLLD